MPVNMDQKRDVHFHKYFGAILEIIQQNISNGEKRAKAVGECIHRLIEAWPPHEESKKQNLDEKKNLEILLPIVRRLAYKCPFSEVREPMLDYLQR